MQRKQSPAFCLSGYLDNRAEGFPDIRQTWHGSGGSIYFLISEKGFAKIPTEKKTLYMELNVETKKRQRFGKKFKIFWVRHVDAQTSLYEGKTSWTYGHAMLKSSDLPSYEVSNN